MINQSRGCVRAYRGLMKGTSISIGFVDRFSDQLMSPKGVNHGTTTTVRVGKWVACGEGVWENRGLALVLMQYHCWL